MKKIFGFLIVLVGFILVTFFGLGPVMFADGGMGERIATLAGVFALYAVLIVLYRYVKKMQ